MECWNYRKTGHMKRDCRAPEERHDVLLLSDDNPIDSWVLDFTTLFHTTTYHDIMENYVAGNYRKVYLIDGEPLDIVGMDQMHLKMLNRFVWKIRKVRYVSNLMCNLISIG